MEFTDMGRVTPVTSELQARNQAGSPIIEVKHVTTRFGKAVVHDDISLTINRGEIFAIAGGNGCGKSTLLREIIGLLTPSAGSVRLFGIDSRELEEAEGRGLHRRFGVMFQHGALFSSLTLADNVAVPLREHTDLVQIIGSQKNGSRIGKA